MIPKKGRPEKWCLIIDLSLPRGRSINDVIDEHLSSIKYTSIDDAANFIQVMGRGTLLAKLDLKEAYRAVPVHPPSLPTLFVATDASGGWGSTAIYQGQWFQLPIAVKRLAPIVIALGK